MFLKRFFMIVVCGLIVSAAGAAQGQDRLPLKIRLGDVSINKVPFLIAKDLRIYDKYGLDVDVKLSRNAVERAIKSGAKASEEVISDSGRPDISIGGCTPAVVGVATNVGSADTIILATTDHKVRWHIFAQKSITRPEELKGKRLAVTGISSMTGYIGRMFAVRMGWNPEQDISIMTGSLGADTLVSGVVDAAVVEEIHTARLRMLGYKPLIDTAEWNAPIGGSGVLTTKTWLREPANRDKAIRFLKATIEAISILKKDEGPALQSMTKWYGMSDREQMRMVWLAGRDTMSAKPYPAVEGIKKTMELYNSNEMRRHKPEDFYDASLIRELDQSGFIDQFYKK